jgi:hypothetical protein
VADHFDGYLPAMALVSSGVHRLHRCAQILICATVSICVNRRNLWMEKDRRVGEATNRVFTQYAVCFLTILVSACRDAIRSNCGNHSSQRRVSATKRKRHGPRRTL